MNLQQNYPIYEPREDSFLLEKYVKKYSKGRVLDMGTGSGIQALIALKNADEVIAIDINLNAINLLKPLEKKNFSVLESNLFSNVQGKFDVIIFNPPYLPYHEGSKLANTPDLSGGLKGYELIQKFLESAKNFLKENGIILLVYSSLSKPEKIDEIIEENGFHKEILEKKNVFFETIYVVLIKLKRKTF